MPPTWHLPPSNLSLNLKSLNLIYPWRQRSSWSSSTICALYVNESVLDNPQEKSGAAAAQAALKYAHKEAKMEIKKAKLQANLLLLIFEREATKEAAEALI